MPKVLIVGDCHVTPQEIEDCNNLANLILETVEQFNIEQVLFLGDLYHANSIVHTPAIAYWNSLFVKLVKKTEVIALVGNHDQFSHTIRNPYSLIIHAEQNERIHIIDKVQSLKILPNVCLAPYYAEPELFFQDINNFKMKHPDCKTLVCHQTFNGAKFNEGFYAKDAVEATSIPFDIISGHIHTPHAFNNVWYPGSPRWRILSDANIDRAIYIVEFNNDGSYNCPNPIPTNKVCKSISKFIDSPESPVSIVENNNADIRIDVYGPPEYVKDRMIELKAKYNAKCRPFPTKTKKQAVSEADGIEVSFNKFSSNFTPPNKTPLESLLNEVAERLK